MRSSTCIYYVLLGEENKVDQRHFLSETRDWTGASIIALARLAVDHGALQFLHSNTIAPTRSTTITTLTTTLLKQHPRKH